MKGRNVWINGSAFVTWVNTITGIYHIIYWSITVLHTCMCSAWKNRSLVCTDYWLKHPLFSSLHSSLVSAVRTLRGQSPVLLSIQSQLLRSRSSSHQGIQISKQNSPPSPFSNIFCNVDEITQQTEAKQDCLHMGVKKSKRIICHKMGAKPLTY